MAGVQRNEKILKTGHLYKQGGSYRNWNRRYFILRSSTLSYFAAEGDKNPKGVIDLTKGRGVRTKEHCHLSAEEWPKSAHDNVSFGLAVENRTYHMYGYDQAAVDDWRSILQQRIQEVGSPDSNYKEDPALKPQSFSSRIFHGGSRKISHKKQQENTSSNGAVETTEDQEHAVADDSSRDHAPPHSTSPSPSSPHELSTNEDAEFYDDVVASTNKSNGDDEVTEFYDDVAHLGNKSESGDEVTEIYDDVQATEQEFYENVTATGM